MTREEAASLLNKSIDLLVQHDSILLEVDVTERALSHQLARYMAFNVQPPLSVDCEYNRHAYDPKRLELPHRDASESDIRARTVFPDIIVHERQSDDQNLLVVEVKKPGEDLWYDTLKLRAFQRELGYRHAAHLILGLDGHDEVTKAILWLEH